MEIVVRGHAVFDLDGTLLDSVPLCVDILNAMLVERGSPRRISLAQARPHVTAAAERMIEALLSEECGATGMALAEFRARYASLPTPSSSLFSGVREGLATIRGLGLGLAIWSNKPQGLCDKLISELGLAQLFDAVVGTAADVPLKPDPTGFDRALTIAGGCRAHSCFVGDSHLDYLAAKVVGVPAVIVTYGYGAVDAHWPDAIRAETFAEVPAIISRLLSERAEA